MKTVKLIGIIACIGITVVGILAILYTLAPQTIKEQVKNSPAISAISRIQELSTPNSQGPAIVLNSDVSGVTISPSSNFTSVTKEYLIKLELWPFRDVPFIRQPAYDPNCVTGREIMCQGGPKPVTVSPKKVIINLKSMDTYTNLMKEKKLASTDILLIDPYQGKDMIIYMVGTITQDKREITISVFIDYSLFSTYTKAVDKEISLILLKSIFYNFRVPPLLQNGNPDIELYSKLGDIKTPLVTHKDQKSSFFHLPAVFHYLIHQISPPVYAQLIPNAYCPSTYKCGTLRHEDIGTCHNNSSKTCSGDFECLLYGGGPCDKDIICEPNENPESSCFLAWDSFNYQYLCLHECYGCVQHACAGPVVTNPIATPVPTIPGTTPAPTGGTWGGCGSCGDCTESPPGSGSHPSSECVSTPEGGCTWDPSSCRRPPPSCNGAGDYSTGETCCNTWEACDRGKDPCGAGGGAMCCSGLKCGGNWFEWTVYNEVGLRCSKWNWMCGSYCGGIAFAQDPVVVIAGQNKTVRVTRSSGTGSVTSLRFSGNNNSIARVRNLDVNLRLYPPSNLPYDVTFNGIASGSTTFRVDWGLNPGSPDQCRRNITVNVVPPPRGNIRARATLVNSDTASCLDIQSSTDSPSSTVLSLNPAVTPASQTQSSNDYVQWTDLPANVVYSVNANPGAGYTPIKACWRSATRGTSGEGSATLSTLDTLIWDIGYKYADPWTQVADGDAIVATTITDAMPAGSVFNTETGDNTNGVVTYGSVQGYDFSPDPGDKGETQVSTTGWLAESAGTGASKDPFTIDWYQYFANKFDVGGLPNQGVTTLNSKPDCTNSLYYNSGSLTIDGANWTVGANEKCIIIVNGPLTINKNINISSGGFATFIVNGNITVDPSVGKASSLSSPALEGIFITSRAGIFNTGTSGVGTERFVLKGTVIAGGFQLQRDLQADNTTISSELFLYNPALLFSMPTQMQDLKVRWEEVAP